MNRRHFIRTTALALAAAPLSAAVEPATAPRKMGVTIWSYGIRWRGADRSEQFPPFKDALDVLDHCHRLGAGGVQIGVGGWQGDFAGKVRDRREQHGMFIEGQIALPRDEGDVPRFKKEIADAREAGAAIVRTVCLGGRRYETFDSAEAFRSFQRTSWKSLMLAEPAVRRARVKLAVENHKDWRVPELLEILRRLESEWVGVNLDCGNSMALLEDPMEVIEALAPFAVTTHFKDMAVREYDEGFLLSEVPLGEGLLDLKRVIQVCQKSNPAIRFNLEMITRDPLKVPCLTDRYWATFTSVRGRELARTLAMVRQRGFPEALPRISERAPGGAVAFEEENVLKSFAYARSDLGFA